MTTSSGIARLWAVALALALVAALLMPVGGDRDAPAMAKGRTRTVTRTFASGTSVTIPATGTSGKASPYPVAIRVRGLPKGRIEDVDVTLRGLSHTAPGDIDMLLAAPDGQNALFFGKVGRDAEADDLTITLDDEAADPLPEFAALTNGRFRPTYFGFHGADDPLPGAPPPSGNETLSAFDGGNPTGDWRLYVFDNVGNDIGTFDRVELTITARVKHVQKRANRAPASAASGPAAHRRRRPA